MDTRTKNCSWNILNWDVRGLNSQDKCNDIRAKIEESRCSIFCLQETKADHFDSSAVCKLAPKRFNKFSYTLSVGTSGGGGSMWDEMSILLVEISYSLLNL
jgi:exonuclease III